jgi:hypothetical protein
MAHVSDAATRREPRRSGSACNQGTPRAISSAPELQSLPRIISPDFMREHAMRSALLWLIGIPIPIIIILWLVTGHA